MKYQTKWTPEKVVLLEIPGVTGWALPTKIKVETGIVSFTWEMVAGIRPMTLTYYRLWFGDGWHDFNVNITLHAGDTYEVTATLVHS